MVMVNQPSHQAHPAFRILLVEDNKVNQALAITLLEKHGYLVVVADNGRQALAILEEAAPNGFDLVLMDIQMPELDGIETTAAIRQKEKINGRHIPIVAVTAHALKGDAERCLAAGMDGYISKPIRSDELFRVVETHTRISEPAAPEAPCQQIQPEILDMGEMLKHVDGDADLLRKLVEVFWDACPGMLSNIKKGLENKSPEALETSAHALKGSLSYFGSNSAFQTTLKLEKLGHEGTVAGAGELFSDLEKDLSRLKSALGALGKGTGPEPS